MDDDRVLAQIHELVDEEHKLRQLVSRGRMSSAEERTRLGELEEALDQCWDLLRRRRAARDAGNDPNAEQPHTVDEVEQYLQ